MTKKGQESPVKGQESPVKEQNCGFLPLIFPNSGHLRIRHFISQKGHWKKHWNKDNI